MITYFMCMSALLVCVCACVPGTCGGQMRGSDLELESCMVVSHQVELGTEPQVLCKSRKFS